MLKRKGISLLSLAVLLLSIISWQPRSGLSSDNPLQTELSVKATHHTGDNNSAVWVRNLSTRSTKMAVGISSTSAPALSYVSEPVAGGATVRLDESLPAVLRDSDLLVRSDEQVAAIVAPAELPIDQSEFYYSRQQEDSEGSLAPRWAIDLAAVGKSGANVLKANDAGYAPAVTIRSEADRRYILGVGVALRRANSSVEIRLINKMDQVIKSLVLTSSTKLSWRADLGEFISGTDGFPKRLEIEVLAGKAQGLLSVKDLEADDTIILPVAPVGKNRGGIQSLAAGPYGGGYASFTSIYAWPFSSYYYIVTDAPPNTCGTLKLIRNGRYEEGGGWICTDSNGYARKGPWTGSKTETGQSVRIEWPDGTRTYGGDYHVDDNTRPTISADVIPGTSVPIPSSFSGWASDVFWGTGFRFGADGWSPLYGTFRNVTTGLYWNGIAYAAASERRTQGTSSPAAGGYDIHWSVTPPPRGVHNSTDTYEWCVKSGDYFYKEQYCFSCYYFYGPR